MSRKCVLSGKRPNVANNVSHSNRKSKKRQVPNLQYRRLWWDDGGTFVRIRVSTSALRTIDQKGLSEYAREAGVDLSDYAI
jgi:large subunit ribosomal protein L28